MFFKKKHQNEIIFAKRLKRAYCKVQYTKKNYFRQLNFV